MTISEQIDKLEKEYSPSGNIPYDNTPDGVRNARSLHDAMQIIRALTALPTETEIEAVAKELYANNPAATNSKPMTWDDCFDVFPERIEECLSDAKAAISAFLKGRGGDAA